MYFIFDAISCTNVFSGEQINVLKKMWQTNLIGNNSDPFTLEAIFKKLQ